ncbi:MAG: amidase family protein [Alphaproteobacteria bacterium]|nr:amidase family protein [Alphaproteobacteria bacterium]
MNISDLNLFISDLFCTKGIKTTAGSRMLENFIPPYESTVNEKLSAAGAKFEKITPFKEFCGPLVSSATLDEITNRTCVEHKPTYGLVSRFGVISRNSSMDGTCIASKNINEAKLILNTIAGFDPKDATSADTKLIDAPLDTTGLKIGLIGIDKLDSLSGAKISKDELNEPDIIQRGCIHRAIQAVEAFSNLAKYDGVRYGFRAEGTKDAVDMFYKTRAQGFTKETKELIIKGAAIMSDQALLDQALKARQLLTNKLDSLLLKYDFIITERLGSVLPDLIGHPVTSIGNIHIAGKRFDDLRCLSLAGKILENK